MKFILIFLILSLPFQALAVSDKTGLVNQTSVSVTGTSTLILARNELRNYLLIQNVGTDTIIVKFNSAQSGSEGIQIPAGGNYEPGKVPVESVWIESAAGTQATTVLEGQ